MTSHRSSPVDDSLTVSATTSASAASASAASAEKSPVAYRQYEYGSPYRTFCGHVRNTNYVRES